MNTPNDYLCPITHELMELPVILIEDGRSYEKRELEIWLRNHNTSPITNKVLKSKHFIVNINLKNAIDEFREKQIKAQYCEKLSNTLVIKTGALPQEFQNQKYPNLRIKICVFGDERVGKTTIVKHLRFQDRISKTEYVPTAGPDSIKLHLDRLFEDRYAVSIRVYDLPGELKHKDVWRNHYQCHGAILMFDVTRPDTLKEIENAWYPALKKHGFDVFECVLLCNKIDLADNSESQIFKDAERFSTNNDLSLYYTSAITGKNVQAMVNQLVLCILNNRSSLNQLKQNIGEARNTNSSQTRNNNPSIILEAENIVLKEKNSSCCISGSTTNKDHEN
ncbi:unnamed protein product [Rotaria sp. Silwood1]|nr:unnamed protein product [Rotaria sp. Silwood1]CAF4855898.1 unnamed protein product [Rotaria sp. Silwood1]